MRFNLLQDKKVCEFGKRANVVFILDSARLLLLCELELWSFYAHKSQ